MKENENAALYAQVSFTSKNTCAPLTRRLANAFILFVLMCFEFFLTGSCKISGSLDFRAPDNHLKYFPSLKPGRSVLEDEVIFEKRIVTTTYFQGPIDSMPLLYHGTTKKEDINYVSCGALPSYREISTFWHLKNAFASPSKQVGLAEGGFWRIYTHAKVSEKIEKTVAGYQYAVYPPSPYSPTFGHFINDCLCSILEMPQWVWDLQPAIICNTNEDIVKFYLNALGLGHLEIVNPKNNYVFCENLYIVKGNDDYHGFSVVGIPLLQKRFREIFGLDKIEPTKYCYMNRATRHRYFFNLDEIINETEKVYNIEFHKMYDKSTNRTSQLREYAEAKLIVSPTGSNSYNGLVMKSGTAMILLMADFASFPEIRFTQMLGVWSIGIMHMHMQHYGRSGNGNKSVIIKSVGYALHAIEHGRWPKYDSDFHVAVSIPLIKEASKTYGTAWVDFKEIYTKTP